MIIVQTSEILFSTILVKNFLEFLGSLIIPAASDEQLSVILSICTWEAVRNYETKFLVRIFSPLDAGAQSLLSRFHHFLDAFFSSEFLDFVNSQSFTIDTVLDSNIS